MRLHTPYIREFLINSLLLQLSRSRIPQVCDELDQSTHIRAIPGAPAAQESSRS
jgi:hypothetical protein